MHSNCYYCAHFCITIPTALANAKSWCNGRGASSFIELAFAFAFVVDQSGQWRNAGPFHCTWLFSFCFLGKIGLQICSFLSLCHLTSWVHHGKDCRFVGENYCHPSDVVEFLKLPLRRRSMLSVYLKTFRTLVLPYWPKCNAGIDFAGTKQGDKKYMNVMQWTSSLNTVQQFNDPTIFTGRLHVPLLFQDSCAKADQLRQIWG